MRPYLASRWGKVIIPSREEILNIPKVKLYSPDLSYLEKAPQTSLAGRLARPKFQPKDVPEQLAREQKTIDVAALTQKRIEKRLAREEAVQNNLASMASLLNSPGPLPCTPPSTGRPSVERSDDELSPLARKRREERRLREKTSNQDRRPPRRSKERSRQSNTSVKSHGMDFESVALEAASPTVHAPEFNGPDPIPKTIDLFNNIISGRVQPSKQHSIKLSESPTYPLNPNIINSLADGDYSRYASLSSTTTSSNESSPVVKMAEHALCNQRDYNIPQRKHAIQIINTLVANLLQPTKERQATA